MQSKDHQEQVYAAFLAAIRSVGMKEFRKSSLFGSNELEKAEIEEKLAA